MTESIKRRINALSSKNDAFELRKLLEAARTDLAALLADVTALYASTQNYVMSSPGLQIAGGKKTAEAANDFFYVADGTVVFKAAGTDMSAITGTLATAKACAWAFYGDSAGTITTSSKTADVADLAAAVAAIMAVAVPADKALIGYLIVANATGVDFVGGTTDLDTVSITDTYINTMGPQPAAAQTSTATLIA